MPAELKPNWKRKAQAKNSSSKIPKVVDIEERLKELEQKEKSRKDDDEQTAKDDDKDGENVILSIIPTFLEICVFDWCLDNFHFDFQISGIGRRKSRYGAR